MLSKIWLFDEYRGSSMGRWRVVEGLSSWEKWKTIRKSPNIPPKTGAVRRYLKTLHISLHIWKVSNYNIDVWGEKVVFWWLVLSLIWLRGGLWGSEWTKKMVKDPENPQHTPEERDRSKIYQNVAYFVAYIVAWCWSKSDFLTGIGGLVGVADGLWGVWVAEKSGKLSGKALTYPQKQSQFEDISKCYIFRYISEKSPIII